jgi:hypothetical protein
MTTSIYMYVWKIYIYIPLHVCMFHGGHGLNAGCDCDIIIYSVVARRNLRRMENEEGCPPSV